ncbi:4'-phosphopantetheinyl transferase [Catenibacillus scindens]|uniref:4'-phosphopantetheinyl transferase n=1 Tax=Catenibacillus scindens TaxID=673271 RepID=A0A7W8H851_9FIRM|nr:4'-phosphopantetheinyl transferase superfamily protein [Catenibacillus scindens]MBB5262932.1 4'-phosphopantetheinyl transferase [Catenibacillus scindens]
MVTIYLNTYDPCPPGEKYNTEHNLGRSLLVKGLYELYHISTDTDAIDTRLEKTRRGKPFLKDYPHIHFNISHCSGMVACGFSSGPLGLDLEKVKDFKPAILRKALTRKEAQDLNQFKSDPWQYNEYFFRLWTLKESLIKQSGAGLSMPLTDVGFKLDLSQEPVKIHCSRPGLYFYQQLILKDYILSLCLEHHEDRPPVFVVDH